MAKIIQHYQTSKLSVDHNRQHNDGTLFICSCFTPGATIDIEPEYLVKTVTYNELKDHISDGDGNVHVCTDNENGYSVSFDTYLAMCDSDTIDSFCAEVINRRENRTHIFDNNLNKTA